MKGKILLATGLAVGYVLGARAGRERYEQIKSTATRFWNDPRVQKPVHTAEDFVKDKAPEVAGFVADQGKKVAAQVSSSTSGSGSGTRSESSKSASSSSKS